MVYSARYPRWQSWYLFGILVFLLIIDLVSNQSFNNLIYAQIALCVLIFVTIMIRFKFTIHDGFLTYQVFLFLNRPIYTKVIKSSNINKIKFKRVNWATKGAVIQPQKGFNIRIIYFLPGDVLDVLLQFADENGIEIDKTRDYLILERWYG